MVHRTGSIGGGSGQLRSGNGGVCRHAPHGALEKSPSPEPPSISAFGGNNDCRLVMTAGPSMPAIYRKPLPTPLPKPLAPMRY
jgi:hypothetical protein